jgi:hypothetical protein
MRGTYRCIQSVTLLGPLLSLQRYANRIISVLSLPDLLILGLVSVTGIRVGSGQTLSIGRARVLVLAGSSVSGATRALPLTAGDMEFTQSNHVLSGVTGVVIGTGGHRCSSLRAQSISTGSYSRLWNSFTSFDTSIHRPPRDGAVEPEQTRQLRT